jgi:hypothetical protein
LAEALVTELLAVLEAVVAPLSVVTLAQQGKVMQVELPVAETGAAAVVALAQ